MRTHAPAGATGRANDTAVNVRVRRSRRARQLGLLLITDPMLALMLATLSMSAPPRFSRRQITLAAVTGVGTAASPRTVHAMEPDVPLDPAQLEPEAARKLLALVEGRRPSEWREEEKAEVDALIEEVVKLRAPWPRGGLRGKWQLAYLQPGPDGTGVDRRIPFPELPGNDSFQIFGADSVTNVGELLGRSLEVRVSGSLSEEDERVLSSPKRFRADINRGQLCAGAAADAACLPLPIKGVGLFDGVYLDRRLRIGQNLNGGGARIVQVRVDS